MPFVINAPEWLEIEAARVRLGLTEDEARIVASETIAWRRTRPRFESSDNRDLMLVDWVDPGVDSVVESLLQTYPAIEVDIAALAIARRPLTSGQFRQFMADTGETERPSSWGGESANEADDMPVSGVTFPVATAIAEWAGGRLPFEDEWEHAVRGADHRVFPWGNVHGPVGSRVLLESYPTVLPSSLSRNERGLEGAVCGQPEWCADLTTGPRGEVGWRVLRGAELEDDVVASSVSRRSGDPYAWSQDRAMVRLVRADGRKHPAAPTRPSTLHAFVPEARAFESRVVAPALEVIRKSSLARTHAIAIACEPFFRSDATATGLADLAAAGAPRMRGRLTTPGKRTAPWTVARALAASAGNESFVWMLMVGILAGRLCARAIACYRRGDGVPLRIEPRLGPDAQNVPVEALSRAMLSDNLLATFEECRRTVGASSVVEEVVAEPASPVRAPDRVDVPPAVATAEGDARIIRGVSIEGYQGIVSRPSVAPDGRRIVAYDSRNRLLVHSVEGDAFVRMASREAYGPRPRWSPDGRWMVFSERGGLALLRADDLSRVALLPGNWDDFAFGGSGAWMAVTGAARLVVVSLPDFVEIAAHDLGEPRAQYFTASPVVSDPDGPIVLVGDDGGSSESEFGEVRWQGEAGATFYDVDTRSVIGRVARGERVRDIAFDRWRGVFLLATDRDTTIWSRRGELLGRHTLDRPVSMFVVTEGWVGTVDRHKLDLRDAITLERFGALEFSPRTSEQMEANAAGTLLVTSRTGVLEPPRDAETRMLGSPLDVWHVHSTRR